MREHLPSEITVTDQVINISSFSEQWKENVIKLAEKILNGYETCSKSRFVVAIGGASGSSKSTTAVVLEYLLSNMKPDLFILNVGQDGYHYRQEYLENNLDSNGESLAKHKGRYDSFDIDSMKHDLEMFTAGDEVSFPVYSRKIHNPIDGALTCNTEAALLLFEGLWLLYDEKPWNEILNLYDLTVFFHAPGDTRKNNTIARHVRGNEHSLELANSFYEKSDAKNAELILAKVSKHDLDFYL